MSCAQIPDAAALSRTEAGRLATEPEKPPRRMSLIRYSPAMVLLAIAIADAFRMADPDLWGHIRFGQMYLASGHLLSSDPFSYSAPGHLWLHHEWLAEAAMAWLYAHLGVIGLKLLKFACSAGTVIFVALAIGETGAPVTTQFAVLLLTSIALTLGMQFRFQMIDFLASSAIVWLLARDCPFESDGSARGPNRLWLAIPVFALWSNLHGGYFVGIAAIGTYAAVTIAWDLFSRRGLYRGVRLAGITLAAALATLFNPLGFESWRTIAVTMRDSIASRMTADFRPLLSRALSDFPHIGGLYAAYGLALIAACAMVFLLVPSAGDFAMVAVAALMSAAAFAATRNLSFAAIAIAPVLARRVGMLSVRATGSADEAPRRWTGELIPAVLAIVLMAGSGLFSPRLKDALPVPDRALAFMDAHGLSGNVLNEFVWGQYLIWHCAPRCRVFIDGRFDLAYPIPVIMDYAHFARGEASAITVLASYPHDLVLIETGSRSYRFMTRQGAWKLIYRDEDAALFAPASSSAANIAGTPVIGHASACYFP